MHTVLPSLATLLLVILLFGCSSEPTPQEHVEQAKLYLSNNEGRSAQLELKNALQKDSSLAEARWLLGQLYLDSDDLPSAEKELARALSLGWDRDDVVPAYARALVAAGKYAEAVNLSDDQLTESARADLYGQQAMANVAMGKNHAALALIDKSIALQPSATTAWLAKARLQVNVGELEAAEATLQSLIDSDVHSDKASAWLAMGELQLLKKDEQRAIQAYEQVLASEPDNLPALYQRSLLALQAGDLATARRGARRLLKAAPKSPGANFIQGYLELQTGRYDRARQRLDLAEPLVDEYPQILFFQALCNAMLGNTELAAEQAIRFNARLPGSARGHKLLATIHLREGDFQAAEELIRPVVAALPQDVGALRILSNALLRQGKTEEGIAALAQVAELEPESARAQVTLGAGLLLEGRSEDARLHLETALELEPEYAQADLLLALSELQAGNTEAALDIARSQAEKRPGDSTPLNLQGYIHTQAGDLDRARASYQQALALAPGDPGAHHSLAQLALREGDHATAQAHYHSVLEHHENDLNALLQLAMIDARLNDETSLQARLEQAIQAHPQALQPRIMLARYYLATSQPEKVVTAFVALEDARQQQPAVLRMIAIAQVAQKEHAEALFTLEKIHGDEAGSVHNLYLTGLAASGSGDTDLARQHFTRALAQQPSHLPSRLALAKILARQERYDELAAQLEQLSESAPDNADVLLLQAALARHEQDHAAALAFATRAFEQTPNSRTVLALGAFHDGAGDPASARSVYREWLAEHPDDSMVHLKLAADELSSGDDPVSSYRQIIERDPDNVIALNNLAWVLRESEPEESLSLARRAVQLEPENPAVLDTLAMVELANRQLPEAQKTIRRALDYAPGEPTMLFHLALIEEARGRNEVALQTLETVLYNGEDFPEKAEAQALYNSLSN